jgi:hypothetical protein
MFNARLNALSLALREADGEADAIGLFVDLEQTEHLVAVA